MKCLNRRILLATLLLLGMTPILTACDLFEATAPTDVPATPPAQQIATETSPAPTGTPLLSPPTRTPAPVAQPTPTYDPGLPDWSILVYVAADNVYARPALELIDRIEAAGGTKQVNVILQVDGRPGVDADGGGAMRRYLIRQDDQPGVLASEPLAELPEANMGDPQVLADFVSWGISTFPANRYALMLWGEGAGWQSLALDQDVGLPGESDLLTLADLSQALADGLAETGIDKLDLIGFDAGLTSQVAFYEAAQPFANFAVGTASLLAGRGWDYRAWLPDLYQNPNVDGRALAEALVGAVGEYQSRQLYNEAYVLAAVDLGAWPELSHWLEQMAVSLTDSPIALASTVAAARSSALQYGSMYADLQDEIALFDLGQIAAALAKQSLDASVGLAARSVLDAVSSSVIALRTGPLAAGSSGVAVYFPERRETSAAEAQLPPGHAAWDAFLNRHFEVAEPVVPPPQLNITGILSQEVGVQNPAYVEFELIGREMDGVAWIAGQREPDGKERLLVYGGPPSPSGEHQAVWRDGLHEAYAVWDARAIYLEDLAGNGETVATWPTNAGSSLVTVQGQFRKAGASTYTRASLALSSDNGRSASLWGWLPGAAFELYPEQGDEFTPYLHYWSPDGMLPPQPGMALIFDEAGKLHFELQPVPDGAYFIGIIAENRQGEKAGRFETLSVSNASNLPGYTAYFDPNLGFQFLYPSAWRSPAYDQDILIMSNVTGTSSIQVAIYPQLRRGADPSTLTREALDQFGTVDLLFPTEPIIIAETRGQSTVYGYQDAVLGSRTGILLTFVKGETGFAIDIDGPQSEEPLTLAAANDLATHWSSRSAGFGAQAGDWIVSVPEDTSGIALAHPVDYLYQSVNEWHRFSRDRATFLAFRFRPSGLDASELVSGLVQDAANGVQAFSAGEPRSFPLSGLAWLRSDFSYQSSDGKDVQGFVMVVSQAGATTEVWAEAPATPFNDRESELFLLMIADFVSRS